jgi:hypothetical protein
MDKFARTSLNPDSLMDAIGMGVDDVVNGVKSVLEKKSRHHS